jgi:diguanylate cyclase (GGDEF)-like protein/PAS domain S-box-containing protein
VPRLRTELAAGIDSVPRVRYRWVRPDGSSHWVEAHGTRMPDPDRDDLFIISIRDVDAEVVAETALREREERFRLLAENASDVVWQVAPDGTIEWASPSVIAVLGHQPADLVGHPMLDFMYPDDIAEGAPARDAAMTGKATSGEVRLLSAEGTARWMAFTIRPVPRPSGLARIATFRDIEQEYLTRRDLEFARGHDSLTGLRTRQVLAPELDEVLAGLPEDRYAAVLCIGVDGLKSVNDALTHYAGDLLLSTIASRLTALIADEGSVARGTGDEFIVVLDDLADPGDAGIVADRILVAMREPVRALRELLLPTVSIGIATSPRGGSSGRLLADSAVALRQSKDAGRDRYTFLDPDLAVRLQGRLALERRIRDGLATGAFQAWLQPVVSLADARLIGYEALARWAGDGDPLSPADFIPAAERTGLIRELDLAIIEQSLVHLTALPPDIFVSVNASAVSLQSPEYLDQVVELISELCVDPSRVHLEVTETTILELESDVREAMTRLADLGVRWYVDDFGTGFSSISHLRSLPIAGLKLDLSFTRGIREGDLTSVHLAKGLFGLAEGLGLHTIAEGVETDVEAMVLASQGWEGGQGWLYGRPAPFEPQ